MRESGQEERERQTPAEWCIPGILYLGSESRKSRNERPSKALQKNRPTWGYVDPALKKEEGEEERRTNRDRVKSEELEPVFRRLMRGLSLNCRTRLFQRVGLALVFQRSFLPIELLSSIR